MYVIIESVDFIHNVKVPPKSLLLVQNDQYVKSEQAIAEIHSGISTLNLKERVRKHISSDLEGEMHWSTDVYHAPEFTYSNVHLLPKTSNLWILSGVPCQSTVAGLLHKDQDQMKVYSRSVERKFFSNLSVTNDQLRHKFFSFHFSDKKEESIPDYSELNRIIYTDRSNLLYTFIFAKNSDLLAKRRKNRFCIPFQSIPEREKELISHSGIVIELSINVIFRRKKLIIAYFDDPRYKRNHSGINKYETIESYSIVKKEDLIEYRGVKKISKVKNKKKKLVFIPEEVHILPRSSSIMVRNSSIIGIGTRITLNRRSSACGLVRVEIKKKKIELTIFSGDIYFTGKTNTVKTSKLFPHSDILISPRPGKTNFKEFKKKLKNWVYVQRITLTKKKYFVLVRPVVISEIAGATSLTTLFPQDVLQEADNVQLQVVNSIVGKPTILGGFSGISIQLVRTCLVLNWKQDKKEFSIEQAYTSLVEVRAKGLMRDFLRIDLVKSPISYIGKRNDPPGSRFISDNRSDRININPFYYKTRKIQESLSQNQGTIRTFSLLNRNNEYKPLIILSSSDCSRTGLFNGVKYYNIKNKSIKRNSRIDSLGPVGTSLPILNLDFFYYFITQNQILVTNYLQLDNFKKIFEVLKFYFIDENGIIYNNNIGIRSNRIWNLFHFHWYFLHYNYCEETSTIMSLGQFICDNVCITKTVPHKKSGQILIVQISSVVIRAAQPYLATPGATVHGHYGEIFYEGDTLVTFIYEKSKSGDITQGLQKVEQVLEVRSVDSISMNLEKRVRGWNERITRILGIPWGFLIGAELTRVQSRISLVYKIQEIYRSQGVQIHNKHIEMIVHQITSKVLVSEDGMSNVFLPGELIGLLRAKRTGRAFEEAICYQVILLGITRTALNTQSFISEASFQETARVLAKASLRGRIDWLKGLKENVVLGSMIPAGTGFKGFGHRSRQDNNIPLEPSKTNLFGGEMGDILFYHRRFFDSSIFKD